jgi:hypothetical protein
MSRMATTSALAFAFALALAPHGSRADDSADLRALRQRIEQLETAQSRTQAELDRVRAELEDTRAARAEDSAARGGLDLDTLVPDSPEPPRFDLHGHLTLSYFGFEETSPAATGPALSDLSPASSFELTDLTFFLGVPLTRSLYVVTEVEYEGGGDDIDVDQAFAEWSLGEHEALDLRIGKFYVPFGIERFYQNAPQNPLVDRPSPFLQIIPGTFSDTGIGISARRALGDEPELVLSAELALMNGLGARAFDSVRDARQDADNNANKALAGRLGLAYDRWLDAGISTLYGEYDDGDEDALAALGFDLRATFGRVFVRGEYVLARVGRPDLVDAMGTACSDASPLCAGLVAPLTPLGGRLNRRGGYVEASFRHQPGGSLLTRDLQYVLRYDDLDEDDSLRDLLDVQRIAAGVVVRPFDHFRLKLQYEISDEAAREFDNNAVLLEGSLDW